MKGLFLAIFMLFSAVVFADFSICDEGESWEVCEDHNLTHNTESDHEDIEDPLNVTGENATELVALNGLAEQPKHKHDCLNKIECYKTQEVGWQHEDH